MSKDLKVGDVVWQMRGRKKSGSETQWCAVPMCIEYIDAHRFLDGFGCGGSLNSIGINYFMTRDDCLSDWNSRSHDLEIIDNISDKTPKPGNEVPSNLRFWKGENNIIVFVDCFMDKGMIFHEGDLNYQMTDDQESIDFGFSEFITLGMIYDQLNAYGDVIDVLDSGPLHGTIYRTGNWKTDGKWYIHGKTMGYA